MVPTLHSDFLWLLGTYYTFKNEKQSQRAMVLEDNEITLMQFLSISPSTLYIL